MKQHKGGLSCIFTWLLEETGLFCVVTLSAIVKEVAQDGLFCVVTSVDGEA